jgi:hypothetical protein
MLEDGGPKLISMTLCLCSGAEAVSRNLKIEVS